ncbi:MAG: hypothetical protein WAU88_04525 [Candidatus Zixiibacteriota bacterium]
MYASIDNKTDSDDSTVIWRYMDFAKFFELISTSTLFFARLTALRDDLWEGRLTSMNLSSTWQEKMAQLLFDSLPPSSHRQFTLKDYTSLLKGTVDILNRGDHVRHTLAVSCWSLCDDESDSFWKIYPGSKNGLAIRTTIGALKQSVDHQMRTVQCGKVTYKDYTNDAIMPVTPENLTVHKRKCFEYEREYRGIVWEGETNKKMVSPMKFTNDAGDKVPVVLQDLIGTLFISPYADNWFHEVISSAMSKFGFAFPIEPSKVLKSPDNSKSDVTFRTQ